MPSAEKYASAFSPPKVSCLMLVEVLFDALGRRRRRLRAKRTGQGGGRCRNSEQKNGTGRREHGRHYGSRFGVGGSGGRAVGYRKPVHVAFPKTFPNRPNRRTAEPVAPFLPPSDRSRRRDELRAGAPNDAK